MAFISFLEFYNFILVLVQQIPGSIIYHFPISSPKILQCDTWCSYTLLYLHVLYTLSERGVTHAYTYDKYNIYIYLSISHIYFFITCFISYHISYTFRVILHFISCSCNCILSSHSSAMLLISCHISYTSHLCILIICFYVSCLHKP